MTASGLSSMPQRLALLGCRSVPQRLDLLGCCLMHQSRRTRCVQSNYSGVLIISPHESSDSTQNHQ